VVWLGADGHQGAHLVAGLQEGLDGHLGPVVQIFVAGGGLGGDRGAEVSS